MKGDVNKMRKIGPNVRFKTKRRSGLDVEKYIVYFEGLIEEGHPHKSPFFFHLYHEITSIFLPNKRKRKNLDEFNRRSFEDIEMMCNLSPTIEKYVHECERPKLDKEYFHAVRKTLERDSL